MPAKSKTKKKKETQKSMVQAIKEGDADAIAQRDQANEMASNPEYDRSAIKKLYESIGGNIGQVMATAVGLKLKDDGQDRPARESLKPEQRLYREKLLTVLTVYSEKISEQYVQDKKGLLSKCKLMLLADLENLIPEDYRGEALDYYVDMLPEVDYDFLGSLETRLFDLSP